MTMINLNWLWATPVIPVMGWVGQRAIKAGSSLIDELHDNTDKIQILEANLQEIKEDGKYNRDRLDNITDHLLDAALNK